jgi:protein-tyrosine-phosphatase
MKHGNPGPLLRRALPSSLLSCNVLFVSQRNAARSLLAEACLNHLGNGRLKGFSCGVPGCVAASPEACAMAALAQAGLPTQGLRCKSWAEFTRSGVPRFGFVITLDACIDGPSWPGQPETAQWTFPDRAAAAGSDTASLTQQYLQDLHLLRRRLELLASLPMRGADQTAVRGDLRDLAYYF